MSPRVPRREMTKRRGRSGRPVGVSSSVRRLASSAALVIVKLKHVNCNHFRVTIATEVTIVLSDKARSQLTREKCHAMNGFKGLTQHEEGSWLASRVGHHNLMTAGSARGRRAVWGMEIA
ncbi:hypothetical protein EVAR_22153_1 [Eumeta japonica]|uniref:Uncharacterized protein n=1 Tax=Eumeta variegata TaxID=151549 RepID=A0A4C1W196_EUMVA|nr:hypothetical protein EVAR_22153_1 [Eumeta japonica]